MSFQSIPKLEDSQFYLDLAFRRAKTTAQRMRTSLRDEKKEKSRKIEMARIGTVRDILYDRLYKIVEGFPSFDQLTPFYRQLFDMKIKLDATKKALGSVHWAAKNVNKLGGQYQNKVKDAEKITEMNQYRKEFYGRISSILNEIDPSLHVLLSARKEIVKFPIIKELPTISITGFPNVGKTTLLSKLTGSEPEIKAYAFTTKRLNLGYDEIEGKKVQFIDTPGTLAREDKMNEIEKLSYLAMRTTADVLLYVWDPTEQYSFELQKRLLKQVESYGKPVIEFASKTDIAEEDKITYLKQKRKDVITDLDHLKREISKFVVVKEDSKEEE